LMRGGLGCGVIHGDRSQSQRQAALDSFKHGRNRVLVATDVAARGIDVEALSHVINYDIPGQSEDYIHRVGRTARAAMTGDAFTFVAPQEEGDLRMIERAIGTKLQRIVVEDFDYKASAPEQSDYRDNSRQPRGGFRGGDRNSNRGGDRNNNRRSSGNGGGNNFRSENKPQQYRDRGERTERAPEANGNTFQPRTENRKPEGGRPTRPWEQGNGGGLVKRSGKQPYWKRSKPAGRSEYSGASRSE
jgi:ATP-dependent RNA helicase RhlE